MTVRVGGVEGQTRVGLLEYDAASGRVLLLRGDVVRLIATDAAARDALLAAGGRHRRRGGQAATTRPAHSARRSPKAAPAAPSAIW